MKWASALPAAYLFPGSCSPRGSQQPVEPELWANDIHSQLNATRLQASARPAGIEGLQQVVADATRENLDICIAGGRHAMGGQQFLTGGVLVDMRGMNRVIGLDRERGIVEVGAGIEWPELIDWLLAAQAGSERKWGIAQKQTGADRLSLGGALAANIHGRGLTKRPIIEDVESFTLIDANGTIRRCSRGENAELFALAIGGYGLFGIIATVSLRLAPRRKLRRVVEIVDIDELMARFDERIAAGFEFGDWQYSTDETSDDFLRRGVFSCYEPVEAATPLDENQKELSDADWRNLILLGHTDRKRAYEVYAGHYLATNGQIYWSDTHQQSTYIDNYHRDLDRQLGAAVRATEMITEIYVPRAALTAFMAGVREDFRTNGVEIIYGTVRLIERDDESRLAWARQNWACAIFNLHVRHDEAGLAKAGADFRRLIGRGLAEDGSYYLTYHRWATREQVLAAHPAMPEFLRLKRQYDPAELFQSDWYQHYRAMFLAV